MAKYDDNLEKKLTAIFGAIGCIAIIINLYLKGFASENVLDALKDIAGLIVVIAVFLVANKLFRKEGKKDFAKLFEEQLKNWIDQNDYLVSEDNFDKKGEGKFNKRFCYMVKEHSNIVTRKKYAKDAAPDSEKGAFVYLPYLDKTTGNLRNEFEFRFNNSTFNRQNIYKNEDGEVNIKAIVEQFAMRINDNFKHLGIHAKPNPSNKTITVSF